MLETMFNNKLVQQSQNYDVKIENQGLIFDEETAKHKKELNEKIEKQNSDFFNKMEQNERKIRFIINDTDSLMKTIKSKTIKPSKSYTTIHKNKIKFFK